jgi:hypothetical protein
MFVIALMKIGEQGEAQSLGVERLFTLGLMVLMKVAKKEGRTQGMSEIKPKPCELCGVDDGKTQMYVGGFVNWAHEKCSKIGCKAIRLHLRRLAFSPRGLEFLAHEIMQIVEEEMERQGFKKVDGAWKKMRASGREGGAQNGT